MKKIISLLLLLALTFTLASCDMLGGTTDNGGTAATGYYTNGANGYFATAEGTIEIADGAAKVTATAPEGTPESKKFDAPATFDATFTTVAFGTGVAITGVSGAEVVIVPKTIDGKAVTGIKAGAFNGVKAVIIATPDVAITVEDGAFKGAEAVYIATVADNLLVGAGLLTDSANVKVYISADEYSNFKVHYNWGKLADSLKKF